nr:hypothetical protein [Azotobacter beijerinckii]
MNTIASRRRKDGTTGYTAQIRIMRDGTRVYQESQTFDWKQVAQAEQPHEANASHLKA